MKTIIELLQKPAIAILFWVVLAFVVYGNTLGHGFVLDDDLVIKENKYVKEGISGVGDIFSNSHTKGATGIQDQGYRPLPSLLYVTIVEFAGLNPFRFHLFNVLFYGISVAILFLFLLQLRDRVNPWLSFFIALVFLVHPVHTEVVANIKGMEDILQFTFSIASLYVLFIHLRSGKNLHLFLSLLLFFFGMLAKETAITYLAVVPLALWFFTELKPKQLLTYLAAFISMFGLYFGIRMIVLSDAIDVELSILNNALVASENISDQFLTALWIQVKYLGLMFFPIELSQDYSFNAIPIVEGFEIRGIIGLIICLLVLIAAIYGIYKRRIEAFGLAFYLVTIALVSNLFILIGATMAERFLFNASFGLIFSVLFLLNRLVPAKKKSFQNAFILVVVLAFAWKTTQRNKDWQSNESLFLADIEKVPESSRIQSAVAGIFRDKANFAKNEMQFRSNIEQAREHYLRSVSILPSNFEAWYNLGVVYERMQLREKAKDAYLNCLKYAPDYPLASNNLGVMAFNQGEIERAESYFRKAFEFAPENPDVVANMGLVYHSSQEYEQAIHYYQRALEINPRHRGAIQNLARVYRNLGDETNARFFESKL